MKERDKKTKLNDKSLSRDYEPKPRDGQKERKHSVKYTNKPINILEKNTLNKGRRKTNKRGTTSPRKKRIRQKRERERKKKNT